MTQKHLASPNLASLPLEDGEVEGSLLQRFARVAATWPTRLAIAAGSERLSYEALDRRSDGLAEAIGRQAPSGEGPVAVLLADQVSTIIGILATWKAGRLCVPVDPAYPPARVEMLLRDSEAGLVVTDREGSVALRARGVTPRQLRMDELDLREPAAPLPRVPVPPDTLAYLFYTSGSTGEPKGVLHTHRNLLHRTRCSINSLGVGPEDRVSALHSPSFFVGLRDILNALLSGAVLLPFDLRRAGLGALASWIDREQVSVLCAVVTTFRHLLAHIGPKQRFSSVRIVRFAGEPLHRQDVERSLKHFPSARVLVAGYGATEAGSIAEYRMSRDTPLAPGRVPAGHTAEGAEVLILDEGGRPAGNGEPGEVVVRSPYLSPGYWRRPDLTRSVFAPDPGNGRTRLYHTGDIGRLRPDGCLEIVGRRDHQVKVRGYRVHPGEIELMLAEHSAIREAVVTARVDVDGETRLVAYVVPGPAPAPHPGLLRHFLRGRLPPYMIPSAFVRVEALPLTANGKVDRAALPPPPAPAVARETGFIRPRSPLEHQIAEIWEELFGVRPIGGTDDFFDLGGDSLLAAAFVTAFEAATGRVLSPAVLFESPTVTALGEMLVREEAAFSESVTALRALGPRPPLFFLHGDFNGGGLYCHALARCLDADRPFYAVHPHGLDGRPVPATIEAMAADRLQALRAVRRHGPYLLGGHCNGGLVALEMARRLRAEGEEVEMVVLVEARAPDRGLQALHRASNAFGRLRGLPPDARAALFARVERVAEGVTSWIRDYPRRLQQLSRSGIRGQAAVVGRKLAWTAQGLARVFVGRLPRQGQVAVPGASPTVFDERQHAYHRAIRRYSPSPYAGRVALFRAEGVPVRRDDLDWSRLLPRLELAVIPGDHHTCVTRHVAALGARLEALLRSAGTG